MAENPAPRKSAELHPTVTEHAIATGNAKPYPTTALRIDVMSSTVVQVLQEDGRRVPYQTSAEHAAAAQLHGWNLHDPSDPVRMPLIAYGAALNAAAEPFQARPEDFKGRDEHAAKVAAGKAKADDKCEAAERCARHGHYEPADAARSPYLPKPKKES